jgi:hypothetical protein
LPFGALNQAFLVAQSFEPRFTRALTEKRMSNWQTRLRLSKALWILLFLLGRLRLCINKKSQLLLLWLRSSKSKVQSKSIDQFATF